MRSQYKAVIPAAGLGTRFLPATKAMPKEMLPVVDKPAIQYVVEEAVAAGIRDVLIIVGRNKSAIDNHFDSVPELERALENKGDVVKLDAVSRASQLADIHLTRQGEPRGLGHAVGRAESYVGDSPFVVMLGDDLIDARDDLLARMLDVHERTGGAVVALMPVAAEQVHLYGVATIAADAEEGRMPDAPPSASPTSSRSRVVTMRRRTSPSSGGTCCRPPSSTCSPAPRRAKAARSS